MSNKEDSTPDTAHATIRAEDGGRSVQFIDQGDGKTELLVMDDAALVEVRVTVDQLDLLHAVELVAS